MPIDGCFLCRFARRCRQGAPMEGATRTMSDKERQWSIDSIIVCNLTFLQRLGQCRPDEGNFLKQYFA